MTFNPALPPAIAEQLGAQVEAKRQAEAEQRDAEKRRRYLVKKLTRVIGRADVETLDRMLNAARTQ